MTDENERHPIVPISANVRAEDVAPYDDLLRIEAYEIFATDGGRSAAMTALLLASEHPDERVPDKRTIQRWAKRDNWSQQADDVWRAARSESLYRQQIRAISNFGVSQRLMQILLEKRLAGEVVDVSLAAVDLKAYELTQRTRERMPDLHRVIPPTEVKETKDETRDEQEANARAALVQRKGTL